MISDQVYDYFVKRFVRYINHLKGIQLCFCLFSFAQCTIVNVFVGVLAHALPVILMFDKMIGSVDSLVSLFVMGFGEYCKMPELEGD